jgi:hypothetical protein
LPLEPPDGEMSARHPLEMVHEQHVDGGAADGANHRQRARGRTLGNDHRKAGCDLGHETADDRRRQVRGTALEQQCGGLAGEPAEERTRGVITEICATSVGARRAKRKDLDASEPRLQS